MAMNHQLGPHGQDASPAILTLDTSEGSGSVGTMRIIKRLGQSGQPSSRRDSRPCAPVRQQEPNRHEDKLRAKVLAALQHSGVETAAGDLDRFVAELARCIRKHRAFVRRLSAKKYLPDDIYSLIQQAVESGNRDEALWQAFLAAHFGRTSADDDKPERFASAARLLCAFGPDPFWAWNRLTADPNALREWLLDNHVHLRELGFGNHRKYESKHPLALWAVVESFLSLVRKYGGRPSALFDCGEQSTMSPGERFEVLYERLRPVERLGRTGRFDFLSLLIDLGMIDAEPDRCYLKGATGPLTGARRVWGDRPTKELDDLAADLSRQLGLSPRILEDALCMWQKN